MNEEQYVALAGAGREHESLGGVLEANGLRELTKCPVCGMSGFRHEKNCRLQPLEVKRCRWCNGVAVCEVALRRWSKGREGRGEENGERQVVCQGCEARGPLQETERQAVEAWNASADWV